jgi:PAS domain S-box-containing protein
MQTEYYHSIRTRFVTAVIIIFLVLAALIFLHVARGRSLVLFSVESAIVVLLVVLFGVFTALFLQQVREFEQVNLELEEQKEALELRAQLLDAASDAILLLDNQGQFVFFNTALQTMTGYSGEELLHRGLHGIEPPEYAARIKDNITHLLERGEAFFESAYLRKTGEILPIEVHARVTNVNGRTLVLSMVRDISERKEADSKIVLAIKEWQGTFDAVEDAVWLLDMDRKIVRANRATQSVFGKSPRGVIGLGCCEASQDDMKQHQDCPFDRMMETRKRALMQMEIGNRWFEVSVDPVINEEGVVINAVHIVKDITTLKKAELRESIRSEILERIASGEPLSQLLAFIAVSIEKESPGALCSILLVDDECKRLLKGAAPNLPDFYNRAANRTKIAEGVGSCGTAAFRRERVVVEDIDTHPFWNGFTPAQEAGLRSCWSEPIFSAGGALLGTFAIYHREPATPGEEEIRLIEKAAIFAGLAIEHSRADQVLRSSEERYRTLVDNLPVVVWEADESSTASFISRRVEQVYGFSQEEMYAAGPDLWFERIHVDDRERVTAAYAAFFTGDRVFDEEYRIMRKDGEWIWLHDFAYAISSQGKKKLAYGVFADISLHKRAELERDELEHLLSQAQKMEAIGHLSGGIAHDFNNLLTPILIYSDMLRRSLPDNQKMRSQLDGITKASGKARDLTQQLLSFGRKQVMQMQVTDLNDIIMSFYSMVRRTLRENINLSLQLASQPAVIRADSSKLEQVLLNLVLNSQDAIAANGTISIETGQVLIDDEFARRHPGLNPGRYVLLSCTDNGCGINDETKERIFEPFFSTKEVGHGTGLGLANVYGIVKQHKGYIMAISTVGVGTTFNMYLPVCDEKPRSFIAGKEKNDIDHTGSAVILLVEDNEMVRVMSRDLLEGFGYTVYCAEYPEQALELVKTIQEKIDLVITDVVMPGMNGQQLFERITAEHPEIDKVLYMSGYTNNIIVTEGELDDGLYFLQKPFTVDALMAKIKELLRPEV